MKTSTPNSSFLNLRNRSDLPCVNGYSETRQRRCAQAVDDPAVLSVPPGPTSAFVLFPYNFQRNRVFSTAPLSAVKVSTTRAPTQLVGPRTLLTPPNAPIPTNDIAVVSSTGTKRFKAWVDTTRNTKKLTVTSAGVSGVAVDVDVAVPAVAHAVAVPVTVSAFVGSRPSASAGKSGSRVLLEDQVAGSGSNNISTRFMEPGKWKTLVQSKREDVMLKQSTSKRSKCRGCM